MSQYQIVILIMHINILFLAVRNNRVLKCVNIKSWFIFENYYDITRIMFGVVFFSKINGVNKVNSIYKMAEYKRFNTIISMNMKKRAH